MTRTLGLSAYELGALAAGRAEASTLGTLRRGRLSRQLLLLDMLVAATPMANRPLDALAVLAEAQRRAPAAVAALLTHPAVTGWTTRQARARSRDLGQLTVIAAVAASLTGLEVELPLAVRGGRCHLPALGTASVPPAAPAYMSVRGGRLAIRTAHGVVVAVPGDPTTDAPGWLGIRRLRPAHRDVGLTIALDDLDPFRTAYRATTTGRLSEQDVGRWRVLTDAAWAMLVEHTPDQSRDIADTLRAIVPLSDLAEGPGRSATSRDVPGAFAMTRPGNAATLAITMIHEHRHDRLYAIDSLLPLHTRAREARYFAPWRADPRPLSGLLHGTYAFCGVAQVWRALLGVRGLEEQAVREFALAREQVRATVAVLLRSPHLTEPGQHFVHGLRTAIEDLDEVALPCQATQQARAEVSWLHEVWCRANPGLCGA